MLTITFFYVVMYICENKKSSVQKMYCSVCRKINKCILLIISPLSLSRSLSNMAGKKGAEMMGVGGLSQTREQNRVYSLFKRLKERETNCKKNVIVYLERIWLYIYRTICEKKPKFIDFSPNIKKTNILPNNFHKISKNIYTIFFSTKFIR